MYSRTEIVETQLGIKVPHQYAVFLETYGDYQAPGIEVYGMGDNLIGYDGMPCVIGATQIRRKYDNLTHRLIVIHHTGLEDEFICLDSEDEKIYAMSRVFGNRKIADSFDEWFQRDIIEYVKEREKHREEFGDDPGEIIDLDWMRKLRHKT